MKTSLVTGGSGFIGSHIVDELVKRNHNVVVIDDLSAKENEEFYFNDEAQYYKWDISKDYCCESLFKGVENVFHLAARSRIQPTINSPGQCFEVNAVGTQRVLEWSRLNGVKNFVYSSTSSLYGHQNQIPFNPNMPADCLNPYSMSKWMGEQICKLYSQLYNFNSTTLRYFNVYGPREPIKGQYAPVVGLFKRQSAEGKPMTIVGDGEQRRDFTYINDIVEANMKAIAADPFKTRGHKIYNVGTGKNYSIKEVANMIGGPIRKIDARPAEVNQTLADITETIQDIGWTPRFNLEDMINSY
jgi:UDP-glucose 4-epimerase